MMADKELVCTCLLVARDARGGALVAVAGATKGDGGDESDDER
jgi:hypothetical protein